MTTKSIRSSLFAIAMILGCSMPAFAEDKAAPAPEAPAAKEAKEPKHPKLQEALKAHCESLGLSKDECRAQIREKCESKGLSKEECRKQLRKVLRKEQRGAAK